MAKILMKGNEAFGRAAIQAGCHYFFGYPITPQSELPEYLSRELPKVGGAFVQAESELAAINMVYGAGGSGVRVMTSSSSPGVALKQEGITYCAGAEVPCVVLNIMRGGPGLGTIQPSQSDYYMSTKGGGNGDYRTPVFAPASVQEAVDMIIEAFDVADQYRTPVMVVADGMIGQMMEPVDFEKERKQRNLPAKDWASCGHQNKRKPNVINSLYLQSEELEKHNIKLEKKYKEIEEKSLELREEIKKLYDSAESGKILRDGLKTVIIGKPNVGKSSLLNSILGENRAIVTEIAGTTRDVIEEFVNIKGIPLKIVDTAGIRETEDIVEKIGVQKSKESIDSADLVIIVLDSSKPLTDEDLEILESAKSKKTIVLLNKIDLDQAIDETAIEEFVGKDNIIKISALKNEGIEQIHDKIESMVFAGDVKSSSNLVITNSRHKDALFKAYNSINDAVDGIEQRLPYDFIEVDFKNIWDYLGYINGDTVQEDLLDTIFSNFCIGK